MFSSSLVCVAVQTVVAFLTNGIRIRSGTSYDVFHVICDFPDY